MRGDHRTAAALPGRKPISITRRRFIKAAALSLPALSGLGRVSSARAGSPRGKGLVIWALAEFLEAKDAPLMSRYADTFVLSARLRDLRGWDCFARAARWIRDNGYYAVLDNHGMFQSQRAAAWYRQVGEIVPPARTRAYFISTPRRDGKTVDAFIRELRREGLDLEAVPAGVVVPLHLEEEYQALLADWPREPGLFCVETFMKHPREWEGRYRDKVAQVAALAPRAALMASMNTHDIEVGDRYLDDKQQYQALMANFRGLERDFGDRIGLYGFYRWALWDEHGHGPKRNGYLSTAPGFQKAAKEIGARLGVVRPTQTTCEC